VCRGRMTYTMGVLGAEKIFERWVALRKKRGGKQGERDNSRAIITNSQGGASFSRWSAESKRFVGACASKGYSERREGDPRENL